MTSHPPSRVSRVRRALLAACLLPLLSASLPAWTAQQLHDQMGVGISYGQHFEARSRKYEITSIGEIPDAHLQFLWDNGFRHIRIPVTWGYRLNEAADGTITVNSTFMTKVKNSVDRALAKGFIVVVNVHHDLDIYKGSTPWAYEWGAKANYATDTVKIPNSNTGKYYKVRDVFKAIWKDIALNLQDRDKLIFETCNEPDDDILDATEVNLINSDAYWAIKGQPGQTLRAVMLAVPSDNNPKRTPEVTLPSSDPNETKRMMKTIHQYNPWSFCSPGATASSWGTGTEWTALEAYFSEAVAGSNGVPINMGEFGVGYKTGGQYSDSVLGWYLAVRQLAEKYNVSPTVWCDSGGFMVFNHDGNGSFDTGSEVGDQLWKTVTLLDNVWNITSRRNADRGVSGLNNASADWTTLALHTQSTTVPAQLIRFELSPTTFHFYMKNAGDRYIGLTGSNVRMETATTLNETDRSWRIRFDNNGSGANPGYLGFSTAADGTKRMSVSSSNLATPILMATDSDDDGQDWILEFVKTGDAP